ncbi:uncharacterized protein NEMAJ01_1129 [Nematocida major]|uniref:uncharacterized protein n=1 Tax=Nematocida major TaxID=1912982 RepID=UPI00200755C4|nr:uncharacterized protein NEMAJ01_1129 [Nematocida major]KAH9386233.1 hypothetical protein NEMAJ01_1129 [Nematocida major]
MKMQTRMHAMIFMLMLLRLASGATEICPSVTRIGEQSMEMSHRLYSEDSDESTGEYAPAKLTWPGEFEEMSFNSEEQLYSFYMSSPDVCQSEKAPNKRNGQEMQSDVNLSENTRESLEASSTPLPVQSQKYDKATIHTSRNIVFILFFTGTYTLILIGLLFMNNQRFYNYNIQMHKYIESESSLQKTGAFLKYLIFLPVFGWRMLKELLYGSEKPTSTVVSFCVLPLLVLMLFTSEFIYKMDCASMPTLLQILMLVLHIISVAYLAILGDGTFKYISRGPAFNNISVLATASAIVILHSVHTLLIMTLPESYAFCAQYIYCTAIAAFFFGGVIGMGVLVKIHKWISRKHVSSDSEREFSGKTPKYTGWPRTTLYISMSLGVLSSAGFIFVAWFGSMYMQSINIAVFMWIFAKAREIFAYVNGEKIISVVSQRISALLSTKQALLL